MSWIQTFTGLRFDLLDPQPDQICIEDIAHALSQLCRFTGHTMYFYSVAQHSLLVSQLVKPTLALVALLHDAPEAYIGDVSSPLKALLPDYKKIEYGIWLAIANKFDLPHVLPDEVKHADLVALMTERRDMMRPSHHFWARSLEAIAPRGEPTSPLRAQDAEWSFRRRAAILLRARTFVT